MTDGADKTVTVSVVANQSIKLSFDWLEQSNKKQSRSLSALLHTLPCVRREAGGAQAVVAH